jgi:SAM-dependent methyltransferase
VAISTERLTEIVGYLKERPGHENVRGVLRELWVVGLGVPDREINFEVPVPEVRGRVDALLGSTVFEIKRDLRKEAEDAERGLSRYLRERERTTGNRYLGIATDGAAFIAYELRDGRLQKLEEFIPKTENPSAFLRWLDTATSIREDIYPDPTIVREEFGRDSLVFRRSMERLRSLWSDAHLIPEAKLKKELWSRHLEFVYGTLIEPDELFLQHTYLTIIAKTMAVRVLTNGPAPAGELLAGTPFTRVGLHGAVETDFFDWLLLVKGGADLVDRIAAQAARFRLVQIEVDVLKAIYESLIDPRQRHYLGEYYTPDWLAEWICEREIKDPLNTRVLDPSCGSGTFLFRAVRHFLAAAEDAGLPLQEALERCTDHVFGLDVHPVAVLFSRVTYLLAIGPKRLRARRAAISVPVYLGDSLQWDVRPLLNEEEIEIAVPGETPLRFPGSVAGDPILLDSALRTMRQLADQSASTKAFQSWLNANTRLHEADRKILIESYEHMRTLHESGRNHIWTYIVRNLTRPLWVSHRQGQPDVLIGNPPWLRYNAMSKDLQQRFRRESQLKGLWVGGKLATHQDLSAYFFARSLERYLHTGGRIAFVMPMAALSRGQYKGFRAGRFGDRKGNLHAIVRFNEVWTFDSNVQPLFEVPSCVIFGQKAVTTSKLPSQVTAFQGQLPRRDATSAEAKAHLVKEQKPWPEIIDGDDTQTGSPYRKRFKQGATIVPRRLMVVTPIQLGRLGADPNSPLVTSRIGSQDKLPWKRVPPLQGQVERRFLRPLLLGESIAPFRILDSATAVIPWDVRRRSLLDARSALEEGHVNLADWLRNSERIWKQYRASDMSLTQQLDYYGKLSSQFPIAPVRMVFAASGTLPCALVIEGNQAVIEHANYWAEVSSLDEGNYLAAILNSETARSKVASRQAQGQWGARHFDKLMLTLPIPRFDPTVSIRKKLSSLGAEAKVIAEEVVLEEGEYFLSARKRIREALTEAGLSERIEKAVRGLLDGPIRSSA